MRLSVLGVMGLVSCAAPSNPPAGSRPDVVVVGPDVADDAEVPTPDRVPQDASPDALAEVDARDVASPSDAAPDATPMPYPSGPHGSAVGQVVANLRWEGYINDANTAVSSTLPFGPIDMGAVRDSGAPFALVHLSGFL